MLDRNRWLALLHPFLFAALPIVSLLAYNINDVPPLHALRPAALSILAAAVLLWLLVRLFKDVHAAALIASVALALFFSFGHVYLGLLGDNTLGLFRRLGLVGQPLAVAVAWLAILAAAVFVILRVRRSRRVLTQAFALMAAVALALPLGQIGLHEIQLGRPPRLAPLTGNPSTGRSPDVYLFILDGYGRADVLREIYAFDNSPFLGRLEQMGFQVANRSHSNYTQTSLSLASMLNMDYLDTLFAGALPRSPDRTPLARMIRWSRLAGFLEQRAYTIVGLPSGYRPTELDNADVFQREPMGGATTLERLAFETSGLVLLQDVAEALGRPPLYPGYRAHRQRLEFVIEQLQQVAAMNGPKFVFAHLLIPHPPFVFDAQGSPLTPQFPFTLTDGDAFPGNPEQYIRGYRDQLQFSNEAMLQILQTILRDSPEPPVIVIHGDHGPGLGLDWQSAVGTDLHERSSNLSAYYLPNAPDDAVPEDITPVNSFRLILDLYFGLHLEMLPERSYYSTWERPYSFVPIDG